MIRTKPMLCAFSLVWLLTACGINPAWDGKFYLDGQPIAVDEFKRRDVYVFLEEDWSKFDKYAKDARNMFKHKVYAVEWSSRITPPIPTYWLPRKLRSITYYAYAEYQELHMHGPMLSRSAPWAEVVLHEGEPATNEVSGS